MQTAMNSAILMEESWILTRSPFLRFAGFSGREPYSRKEPQW